MASKRIRFDVSADSGIRAYWIAVDDRDVQSGDTVSLTVGPDHHLAWWMVGSAGAAITITATEVSSGNVAFTRKSKIPDGQTQGAGVKYFVLS
jgi:hypothetical protein